MAESIGSDAQRYDHARPSYPASLVERIVAGRSGLSALDVGCGTGIAARQLQAAGCAVLGIDPDERMAAYARERGLDVEVATFEEWDPAGRRFDLVTAAQSWHWVDPALGARKVAEVLNPGGRLAIFSHVLEPPEDIAAAFTEALRRVVPDSPFNAQSGPALETYEEGYAAIADSIRETEAFEGVERWRFDWTKSYSRDEWLALLPTTGGLTQLPADKLTEILKSVGAAIDVRGGSFTMEYVTLSATGRRSGSR
ncbi:MAG: class I SAM-dependent methyltransferase [Actinomycetia bacterium]|nr:class I SAM-dependent methyltransferase [Actinomycetes bacterium]